MFSIQAVTTVTRDEKAEILGYPAATPFYFLRINCRNVAPKFSNVRIHFETRPERPKLAQRTRSS